MHALLQLKMEPDKPVWQFFLSPFLLLLLLMLFFPPFLLLHLLCLSLLCFLSLLLLLFVFSNLLLPCYGRICCNLWNTLFFLLLLLFHLLFFLHWISHSPLSCLPCYNWLHFILWCRESVCHRSHDLNNRIIIILCRHLGDTLSDNTKTVLTDSSLLGITQKRFIG